MTLTEQHIDKKLIPILNQVSDPEIPVLTILDMGVVRSANIEGDEVIIKITPTYSGCPAMDVIGWFHTHPGHGLFLSNSDLSVQKHFSQPYQIAMEIDSLTERLSCTPSAHVGLLALSDEASQMVELLGQ